jgi:hypothetical protein
MSVHEIQISEPWDYIHPNGTNKFLATGFGIIYGPNEPNWGREYYLLSAENLRLAG